MDNKAMNAYSLAVAHVAEKSEPEMPTNYGTETEKQDGVELIQLNAQIKMKDDDDESPAADESQAV